MSTVQDVQQTNTSMAEPKQLDIEDAILARWEDADENQPSEDEDAVATSDQEALDPHDFDEDRSRNRGDELDDDTDRDDEETADDPDEDDARKTRRMKMKFNSCLTTVSYGRWRDERVSLRSQAPCSQEGP